jgi:hypothetical protein
MEDNTSTQRGIQLVREARQKYLSATDWVTTVENGPTVVNLKEVLQHRQLMREAPSIFTNYIWKTFPTELDLDAMGFPTPVEVIKKQ